METAPSIREMLTRDHARMEILFGELLEALRADARADADRIFGVLDEELRAHLAAEEEHVLPEFARVDAEEAQALRAEHEEIRRQLVRIGLGVELHAITEPVASGFVESLRAHARREDAVLYRWIDARLEPAAAGALRNGLLRRVTRRFRKPTPGPGRA